MASKQNNNQQRLARKSKAEIFKNNSEDCNGVSLCIPKVHANISWKRIKGHIIDANLGFVERVDVIPIAGDRKFKRAFVHFRPNSWNMRDSTARAALKKLQSGERIKLEYESPWFWTVGISGSQKPDEAPKPRVRKTSIQVNYVQCERSAGAAASKKGGVTISASRVPLPSQREAFKARNKSAQKRGGSSVPSNVDDAFKNGASARVQQVIDHHDGGQYRELLPVIKKNSRQSPLPSIDESSSSGGGWEADWEPVEGDDTSLMPLEDGERTVSPAWNPNSDDGGAGMCVDGDESPDTRTLVNYQNINEMDE